MIDTMNTTDLTRSVMRRCAEHLGLDTTDKEVVMEIYWDCCDLEDWPSECGFGSSDHYSYIQRVRHTFNIPEDMPEAA